ncbi:MAG: GntR family transcriptional regulator [Marmoricola sp.]
MKSDFSGGELNFTSISRDQSLREQVSDALRAALISGRMRPGGLYPAPVLAEMLGVSATPVREAMLDLAREGLVEVAPNKGFRVTAVSERELDELAETRLLLEVPVMGAVAANLSPTAKDRLEDLRQIASELEQAAAGDDLMAYMQLDTEFHIRFLSIHGNGELVKTVRSLRGRTRLYGLERLSRAGTLMDSTREHAQLIDLALAGRREDLEELTRVHIGHVRSDWAAEQPLDESGD